MAPELYLTSSSSVALPASGLLAESVKVPSPSESFTARDFSVEMVETRSTALANSSRLTSSTLSLCCGMTRS